LSKTVRLSLKKAKMPHNFDNFTKKLISWNKSADQKKILCSLNSNEIIISSTDTIYGFLATLTPKNVQKLNRIKKRPQAKSYIIFISSIKKLPHFIAPENFSPAVARLLQQAWPGPLTVIFKAKKNLPSFMISQEKTVALRCPNHGGLQKMLTHFNGLFSTSANITDEPFPKTIDQINPKLIKECAYLVTDNDLSKPSQKNGTPSSIIDVSSINYPIVEHVAPGQIQVIRVGAYPINKLEEYYGAPFKY
jgi:L-threonylcarbamoyladenylate synthase